MQKKMIINNENYANWQNTPETGELTYHSGSWKDYWCKYSDKQWPKSCCRENCYKKAEDGAHVWRMNNTVFIVPLCSEHNPRSPKDPADNPRFELKLGSVLVNADVDLMEKMNKGEDTVKRIIDSLGDMKISDL